MKKSQQISIFMCLLATLTACENSNTSNNSIASNNLTSPSCSDSEVITQVISIYKKEYIKVAVRQIALREKNPEDAKKKVQDFVEQIEQVPYVLNNVRTTNQDKQLQKSECEGELGAGTSKRSQLTIKYIAQLTDKGNLHVKTEDLFKDTKMQSN